MVDPRIIANTLLLLTFDEREQIDHLKLQKLIYLSHGMCLARLGFPLSSEKPQVWPFGPVFPSAYHEFKEFRSSPITRPYYKWDDSYGGPTVPVLAESDAKKIVHEMWWKNRARTGVELSELTHRTDSPWDVSKKMDIKDIDDDLLGNYYRNHPL